MDVWKEYKLKCRYEMRPYVNGENMKGIHVSQQNAQIGCPKEGDMIARNPKQHSDQFLVAKKEFEENLELA